VITLLWKGQTCDGIITIKTEIIKGDFMSYNLYLDESKISINSKSGYSVAGVIIEEGPQLYNVRKELGRVKSKIWSSKLGYGRSKQIVFHEAEIRSHREGTLKRRPEYVDFKKAENIRLAVNGIGNIVGKFNLPVLGVLEDQTAIAEAYKTKRDSHASYYLALEQIIENYCYFLKNHNSVGKIICESRRNQNSGVLDQRVRKMYMKILVHGTLRYSASDLQDCLKDIVFIQKQENDAGLQIADFIPRPFLVNYFKISQTKPSIYQILRKARYDGGIGAKDGASKFGMCIYN